MAVKSRYWSCALGGDGGEDSAEHCGETEGDFVEKSGIWMRDLLPTLFPINIDIDIYY